VDVEVVEERITEKEQRRTREQVEESAVARDERGKAERLALSHGYGRLLVKPVAREQKQKDEENGERAEGRDGEHADTPGDDKASEADREHGIGE